MASATILKVLGSSSALCVAERLVLTPLVPHLYAPVSGDVPFPPLFGLVVLFNLVFSTFVLLSLAMKVGAARSKFKVAYPAMYASGKGRKGMDLGGEFGVIVAGDSGRAVGS